MRILSVALMTMALATSSVIGAVEGDEAVASATGIWTDVVYESGTDTHRGGDDYTVTGVVIHGPLEMSDPRLSGTLVLKGDSDDYDRTSPNDLKVTSGSARMENDEGIWAGTFTAVQHHLDYREHIFELHIWLAGEEAYEGYSAFLTDGEATEAGLPLEAIIYPGDLPPAVTRPAE
jgi:hypothetical protein